MVCSEATTGGVLQKKVFLEISQNSQENNFSYRTVSCLRLLSQESVVNKIWNGIRFLCWQYSIIILSTILLITFSNSISAKFLCVFFIIQQIVTKAPCFLLIFLHGLKHLRFLLPFRSIRPEVFLGKVALKTCSKCTGEHPKCDFNKSLGLYWNRT